MNKHPHIDVIVAYFNGEQIQVRDGRRPGTRWAHVDRYHPGDDETPAFSPNLEYRIKPKQYTLTLEEDELEALRKSLVESSDAFGYSDARTRLEEKIAQAEKTA